MLVILVARLIKKSGSGSFFEKKRATEAVEASEVAEDTEVNKAAEVSKA